MPKKLLTVEAINKRLTDTGVRLYQRGKKLSLRATLPTKDGRGEKQQWVALGLGITPIEMELAEAKAWELHAQKVQGKFKWEDWIDSPRDETLTCAQWLEKYRKYRLEHGFSLEYWTKHDWGFLKRLPPEASLTEELLVKTVLRSEPNSRDRKFVCSVLSGLAKFAGIECDLAQYKGNYSYRKVKARKLPTDEEIATIREIAFIQGRARKEAYEWQWVYGMMATYGLRNHEIFYCKVDKDPPYACRISEGKTGSRVAYPLYPEWAEQWELFDMKVPKLLRLKEPIESKSHLYLGQKVSSALARFLRRLPKNKRHQPYDLRHCYALRGSVKFRLAPRVTAQMMGHDVEVHLRVYSRWLNTLEVEKIYLEGVADISRPLAPSTKKSSDEKFC